MLPVSGPGLVLLLLAKDGKRTHSLCFFPSHATLHLSKCTFIYLFPPSLSFLVPFLMPWTQKIERVCAGPVLYKPVLFSGNKKGNFK